MAVRSKGPGAYVYVCTRMRVRKSKLIAREDYLRMLNMGLPEITRFIEETAYKTEIDELSPSFSGIDLIEVALTWNLAKEYQKILEITPGTLNLFTAGYLRRWDIQNFLTILRGKHQGISAGRIKEILVPAGVLDRAILDRLLAEDSPERVVDAIKGRPFYPLVVRELQEALETGSFAHMENSLYKAFYAALISEAESGLKGGDKFLEYIRLEVDMRNIQNLFRLRQDRVPDDVRTLMIYGGTISMENFQRLSAIENIDELVDSLQALIRTKSVVEMLEKLRGAGSIHETEVSLTRLMLEQMDHLAKRNPFSICPILVYLEKKYYEVVNLRALARGKESNLAPERIGAYLVV